MKTVTRGVPQGSVLGPILFLLYINDINFSTKLNILTFADDTTAYSSHHNIKQLYKDTNEEMKQLYTWLCANKLSLNINKTEYSIFGPTPIKQMKHDYSAM